MKLLSTLNTQNNRKIGQNWQSLVFHMHILSNQLNLLCSSCSYNHMGHGHAVKASEKLFLKKLAILRILHSDILWLLGAAVSSLYMMCGMKNHSKTPKITLDSQYNALMAENAQLWWFTSIFDQTLQFCFPKVVILNMGNMYVQTEHHSEPSL